MTTNSSTDESRLAEKVISIDERGLTSADWVVYNNGTKRTRNSSAPTSGITTTRPLALRKDGTWFAYGWDLTKNICEVFGPAGYIRTAYTYSPYGSVIATGDITQPIQWSSEFLDAETCLVYYHFRNYDSLFGRWLERDPHYKINNYNLYCMCYNSLISFYDRLGLAGATTHGIQKCTKEDTCLLLSAKASQWIASFSERYMELTADKYNLKQNDPYHYNTHIDEIRKAKEKAKDCLTILADKIKKNECCKPGDRKPDSIPNFSPKPIPEKIPENNNSSHADDGISTDEVVENTLYAGGTALAIYVTYRVVRLLPSLLPPLWPTLVPNLAMP